MEKKQPIFSTFRLDGIMAEAKMAAADPAKRAFPLTLVLDKDWTLKLLKDHCKIVGACPSDLILFSKKKEANTKQICYAST